MARQSFDIFDYMTSVFDGSVGDYYLAIHPPTAPDGLDVVAGEWSNSGGCSWQYSRGHWEAFEHMVFHRWNAWVWGMHGYHKWFCEGPNLLYGLKTMAKLRLKPRYSYMEKQLAWMYDTYLDDYVAGGQDKPLASHDLEMFLFARKGTMVTFLMAKEIYARTDGAHNFDDFLQVLFKKYGYHAQPCSEECLKDELAALTGSDFTKFFDDYVYGTTPLPMDWAFEDDDGDGLSNALEIGWDTHPEDEDTDGDGHSDAIEVERYSDPLDPSSIPHVVYLPIAANSYVPPALPIDIDGEGREWESYAPVATDPAGDSTGGVHTDLKAVFAEVGPNYAYLMVEVYDPPLLPEATIEMNLDLTASDGAIRELHTNIKPDGSFLAWADSDGDGDWEEYPVSGAITAHGDVMELRIPLWQMDSPVRVEPTYVNLWCFVDGEWIWVDTTAY
jgi:hypothetical protein